MAPLTRTHPDRTPSPNLLSNKEATTTRRCRFFDVFERSSGTRSLRSIARDCGISEGTARYWKKQGPTNKRRTRPASKVLGHKSRVTKSTCKILVSPSRNPVRKHPFEA
ncbi:hypothetical protein BJ875DRAFT_477674 [Amylocarpus encephaloides]|uniref:PBSX phage terminase small subunit-like N-terminal domain-containing protein n=1 Tax=Amylocarpus encephaloides TaxID=45428 RepID=A0A9P7Y8E8_9HELO|nr:hypothetical protein BJ875DRAFT_477674 [Amylocarpus encephaloides]